WKRSCARAYHRCPARHRLQRRKPESLDQRWCHTDIGHAIELWQVVLRHIVEKVNGRANTELVCQVDQALPHALTLSAPNLDQFDILPLAANFSQCLYKRTEVLMRVLRANIDKVVASVR